MTALGIEASSLIPKPAFLGHATPFLTDFSGNVGIKKKGKMHKRCSFGAVKQDSLPLLLSLSDTPFWYRVQRDWEKMFSVENVQLPMLRRPSQFAVNRVQSSVPGFTLAVPFPLDSLADSLLFASVS